MRQALYKPLYFIYYTSTFDRREIEEYFYKDPHYYFYSKTVNLLDTLNFNSLL